MYHWGCLFSRNGGKLPVLMATAPKIESTFPRVGRILQQDAAAPVIQYEAPLVPEHVAKFSKVIGYSGQSVPPTFYTFFRWGEFEWLRRMGIPLENIVHTEQVYTYHSEIDPGVVLIAETEVSRVRERRTLKMITMATRLKFGDRLIVTSETSFLATIKGAEK